MEVHEEVNESKLEVEVVLTYTIYWNHKVQYTASCSRVRDEDVRKDAETKFDELLDAFVKRVERTPAHLRHPWEHTTEGWRLEREERRLIKQSPKKTVKYKP